MKAGRLFDSWSTENRVICDYRSRFDGLRDRFAELEFNGEVTEESIKEALVAERFDERYPNLPKDLDRYNIPEEEREAEFEAYKMSIAED